jgi:SAM-dependent methyltransferase
MTSSTSTPPASAQSTLWNGHSGHAWVDLQPVLDQMFHPFLDLLVDAVEKESPRGVLDVGCGTGSTTIAIAQEIGSQGHCTGVDISQPMIDVARMRARQAGISADFVHADAQTHDLAAASIDMIVSRFGVMFFDRPGEAFANLRRASCEGALLNVIAWRGARDNPFMTTAERAAGPYIELPARQPGAPGQFAFADQDKVATLLKDGGWRDIDIQPIDVECSLPERELVGYASRLGPVGLALQQADAATRARVIDAVRLAFDQYVHGDDIRYVAACWSIRARSPAR